MTPRGGGLHKEGQETLKGKGDTRRDMGHRGGTGDKQGKQGKGMQRDRGQEKGGGRGDMG